jgi:undecaprenyl diphosphate synthase
MSEGSQSQGDVHGQSGQEKASLSTRANATSTSDLIADIPRARIPKHIAIIMDGNGRWAQARGMQRIEGHRRGVESVREVLEGCREFGIECLTLYCFSSENWRRPADELEFLMELLKAYLISERPKIIKQNVRLKVIGRRDPLPPDVLEEIDRTVEACSVCTGMTLCLAINYGGRAELVDVIRGIGQELLKGSLSLKDVDENEVEKHLYTSGLPDPDLLIRTSGEMRLSNYLLWQVSYSELYVTETLWPEFDRRALAEAIRNYSQRERRFGGVDTSNHANDPLS